MSLLKVSRCPTNTRYGAEGDIELQGKGLGPMFLLGVGGSDLPLPCVTLPGAEHSMRKSWSIPQIDSHCPVMFEDLCLQ
jgi:hypothetical protein